jgi:hypothetical protein
MDFDPKNAAALRHRDGGLRRRRPAAGSSGNLASWFSS